MGLRHGSRFYALSALGVFWFLVGCGEALTEADYIARAKALVDSGEWAAARLEFQNATQLNPENGESRYLLGITHLELADAGASAKELTRALELGWPPNDVALPLANALLLGDPRAVERRLAVLDDYTSQLTDETRAEMAMLGGLARLRSGDLDGMKSEFERAHRTSPEAVGSIFGQAVIAFENGDTQRAVAGIERVLQLDPERPEAHGMKGDIALADGRYEEAIASFRRAVELAPHDLIFRLALAESLTRNGDVDEAMAELERVSNAAPDFLVARHAWARAALKKGDYNLAYELATEVLARQANHLPSHYIAGAAAYKKGTYEVAFEHLKRLTTRYGHSREFRRLVAATRIKLGLVDEALTTLEPILDAPTLADVDFLSRVSFLAMQAGKSDAAGRMLEVAESAAEGDGKHLLSLAISRHRLGDPEASAELLRKALAAEPNLSTAQALLALDALRLNRLNEAMAQAEELTQKQPNSSVGHNLVGLVALMGEDLERARAAFTRALLVAPGDLTATNYLAILLFNEGKLEQARPMLLEVVEQRPQQVDAFMRLAVVDERLDSLDRAIVWLERAVESSPEDPRARAILGRVYLEQGRNVEAEQVSERLARRAGVPLALLHVLVTAQQRLGKMGATVPFLEMIAERDPESATVHQQLATTYRLVGRTDDALEASARALALAPGHEATMYWRARMLTSKGRFDAAEELLGALQSGRPESADLLELQGRIALGKRNPEQAVSALRRAFELRRHNFQLQSLATALIAVGRATEGEALLQDWLKEFPQDALAGQTLADYYMSVSRFSEAEQLYLGLVDTQPNNGNVRNNLAWVMFKQGRSSEAVEHAQRAAELRAEDPYVLDTLGNVLLGTGQNDRALRALRRAANLAPNDPVVKTNLARAWLAVGDIDRARELIGEVLSDPRPFPNRDEAERLRDIVGR